MMYSAWSSIVEVPYCFSRSYVKFQGHTALKIVKFEPNWAFPDSNSSLNSPMAMKCCTKLETAKERCPIVFQGHPSNLKVTRDKTSPILTQIGQLSNPSDLPCFLFSHYPEWVSKEIANTFNWKTTHYLWLKQLLNPLSSPFYLYKGNFLPPQLTAITLFQHINTCNFSRSLQISLKFSVNITDPPRSWIMCKNI